MPKIPTDLHGVADILVEVQFTDDESERLRQLAGLEEGDPGAEELIEQFELATTRFLAWFLPSPFGPSIDPHAERRKALLRLAKTARAAKKQMDSLDSRSRTLLNRSAMDSFALSPNWLGLDNEIARLALLEAAAEDAADQAREETPRGRSPNMALVQLGIDLRSILAPFGVQVTTYPDGAFSKAIGITLNAAKRCAATSDLLKHIGLEIRPPHIPSDLRDLVELVNKSVLRTGDSQG